MVSLSFDDSGSGAEFSQSLLSLDIWEDSSALTGHTHRRLLFKGKWYGVTRWKECGTAIGSLRNSSGASSPGS